MTGSITITEAIHSILIDYPDLPVVLDPIISAGGGGAMSDPDTLQALHHLLLPQTSVLTPNTIEAKELAHEADTITACAEAIQDQGCEFVLVTGTHAETPKVTNTLYGNHRILENFDWERLPYEYHGSGCTLAAAIAGLLAHGIEPQAAVYEAQEYTWQTLKHAYRTGMGQWIPNRFFWAQTDEQ